MAMVYVSVICGMFQMLAQWKVHLLAMFNTYSSSHLGKEVLGYTWCECGYSIDDSMHRFNSRFSFVIMQ